MTSAVYISRRLWSRVYATMIKEWLGYDDTAAVLKGGFDPLGIFA